MPLNPPKRRSNGLDPCQRRVIPGNPRKRVSARSRPLWRRVSSWWETSRRQAVERLVPIYRRLSKTRMPVDPSRTPPNALTPVTGRVIPKTARIARDGRLDPSRVVFAHDARPAGRPATGGILDRASISSGRRIVGVCNDCSSRSLESATIGAADHMLDRSSINRTIRSKVRGQFPRTLACEYARVNL